MNRHAPAGVVHHYGYERQTVTRHRLELLEMQAKCSVAHQENHPAPRIRYLSANRDSKAEAKKAQLTSGADDFFLLRLVHRFADPRAHLTAINDGRRTW